MAPQWKNIRNSGKYKRRKQGGDGGLQSKVDQSGGRSGFGLERDPHNTDDDQTVRSNGIYGGRSNSGLSQMHRIRLFGSASISTRKTASDKSSAASVGRSSAVRSRRLISSKTSIAQARIGNANRAAVHVVCSISENLAKETCVVSLDAGSPTSVHMTKQGNGQTYAETLAYLEILQPDEILLNEGRRNSQLAQKILSHYFPAENEIGIQHKRPSHRLASKKRISHDDGCSHKGDPTSTGQTSIVKFMPRSHFDQTKGADLLRRVGRPDSYDGSVADDYILLSSFHAVLQYTQHCLGASFGRNCLHIYVNASGENRMMIDRSSLLHLELLANAKTGKTGDSLIGTIDYTKTTVGSRLLRTNLMAPPTRVDTINSRLDLVDSFLDDEEFFFTVMDHLESLPDIDKMLTNIALIPWKKARNDNEDLVTSRIASKGISALVCIKSILRSMPAFATALDDHLKAIEARTRIRRQQSQVDIPSDPCNHRRNVDCSRNNDARSTVTTASSLLVGLGGSGSVTHTHRHQLLRAILLTMRQPGLHLVLQAVTDIFTDSTSFTRNAHAMRHEECFALKPKTDGMMDVIRKAFLANVDDIYRLADEYAGKHGIRVNVKETSSRGYFLSIPHNNGSDLPQEFIQPVKSGKLMYCTTEEVRSLNARAQENVQDLLLMTHDRIQEVLDVARSRYDNLASLSDAIALLDMCHSFADKVSSSTLPWSRPTVNTEGGGTLTIQKGRYGIEVSCAGLMTPSTTTAIAANHFVPNDTYAPGHRNFTVLTGVNGSGKSTYLKQIAIIVVLAHCGSYVPSESAIVPIRDRLCTRIGTGDDQEHNISTFLLEMKETAFICRNAGPKSLILIDELGRATSNEDGVAIAWSVSEFLLAKRAMTFFVTHYPQLAKLSEVYSGVQNQHMGASISSKQNGEVSYSHKLVPGVCSVSSDYGVEMATSCGWPDDVVQSARQIRLDVEVKLPDGGLSLVETKINQSITKKAFQTAQHLVGELLKLKGMNEESVSDVLQQIRRLVPSTDFELMEAINSMLKGSHSTQTDSTCAEQPHSSDRTMKSHAHLNPRTETSKQLGASSEDSDSSSGSNDSSLSSTTLED